MIAICGGALGHAAMCGPGLSCAAPLRRPAAVITRPSRRAPGRSCTATGAGTEGPGPSSADGELVKARQQLDRMLSASQSTITGPELRRLVFEKYGRSYDVRLQRRGKRMYLHIMWRFLEQQSFALSEEEYNLQLQAVAEYLTMWGVADTVRAGIKAASKRGPGYTGGGSAKAISIPLDVDVDGARSGEWNSFLG